MPRSGALRSSTVPSPGAPPAGYQPQWINGREVGVGLRDCSGRYRAIKNHLPSGPLRVLDIGAYNGYFCRRLVDDFDAQCVAVDNAPELEPYRNVSVMSGHVTPMQIRVPGGFNVVLCLSVLHHWPNWADYLSAMLSTGATVFIESADPAENLGHPKTEWATELHGAMQTLGRVIHYCPNIHGTHLRPLWVCHNNER